ncbi:unnamed protein product [Microthlaspi erraticum]|uniref:SWIM-type domain-containing protein n=1 Tax=Microthlaspi erraticum TaxID=1685480 RepID=A0A6D2KIV8_9BRAS|nr:unnamed protein product [Microthlaspi erraticum]
MNEELHNETVEEEDRAESKDDDPIDEDDCDCPAINEDAAGYKENEPEFFSRFGDDGPQEGGEAADDNGDDMWNDDLIPDPLTDDEDDAILGVEGRPIPSRPHEILALGKCFNNADEFKYALLTYSLKTEYDIKMYKSSSDRLGAKCTKHAEEKCPWRVYCSFEKSKNKLMVKFYENRHICTRSSYTKILKSRAIGQLFEERLRVNPKIKPEDMVAEIKREFNMIVTEGTTMEVETIPGPLPGHKQRFFRLYVCFGALKEAWKQSCRPIIGLDASFMKWDIKGQMLAAVGRDDLDLKDGDDYTIFSDKHAGLLNAVHEELPKAEHRQCSRHILGNWKKTNKDIELERMFWRIARSYTPEAFEDNLEIMKKYNSGAYDSLLRTAPKTWSRAFFKVGSCCNDNLNNLSESFNRNVREARRKPILDFLTEVKRTVMERNANRIFLTRRWKKRFTPRADKEIEINRQKAKDCKRYRTTGNVHEVDFRGDPWSVDMDKKTCGCGYWQLNGIPCMHAMCVITNLKLDLNDYVSDYYLTSKWQALYDEGMKPVQGIKAWKRLGRLPILPPPNRGNKGRSHGRARFKGSQESSSNPNRVTRHGRIPQCSNCRKEEHNKARCSNPTEPPPPKRPRGRPKKQGQEPQGVLSQASQGASQASQGASQESQGGFSQASQGASQASQGRFGFST